MLLATAAVGVLAGLLLPHLRLHLGLSGHRALFWMVPIIVARLAFRSPAGATVGSLAAGLTSLAAGGQIAGGPAQVALVGVAGAVLDVAVGFAERYTLRAYWFVPLLGGAAALANAVCWVKRGVLPVLPRPHLLWPAAGEWGNLASYAVFGLLAGLLGALIGYCVRRRNVRS